MPTSGRALAVVNQKGGVGKTTTAVNLAANFALAGRATLLIDLDPQANASSAFGVVDASPQVYEVLLGQQSLAQVARTTELETLHPVASGPDLVGAEIEMVPLEHRERRLELARAVARETYEFVVIDCPPSLGLLTLNGLTAADGILIPLQCEYYALEGLARLLETLDRVRSGLNSRVGVEGILLTMVDGRNNLSRQVEGEVRNHFGDRVYKTRIPRNVRLSEAPSHGRPGVLYDPTSSGARAYAELAEEILARVELADPPIAPPVIESAATEPVSATAEPSLQAQGVHHGSDT